MSLLGKMKLQKLTIKAYRKRRRSPADLIGSFEAMYNPVSFSQQYEVSHDLHSSGIDSASQQTAKYIFSKPQSLSFDLVFDGTGVEQIGITQFLPQKNVSERVKELIDLTYRMNGEIHEPNFLIVEWGGRQNGGLIFPCRMSSVNVTYTSFNRDGSPLRAQLAVTLIFDQELEKTNIEDAKASPDLTHTRTVKSGDTLPLLTKAVYGTSIYYLQVAQVNNLDDFRNLTPGQELFFPPLEKSAHK